VLAWGCWCSAPPPTAWRPRTAWAGRKARLAESCGQDLGRPFSRWPGHRAHQGAGRGRGRTRLDRRHRLGVTGGAGRDGSCRRTNWGAAPATTAISAATSPHGPASIGRARRAAISSLRIPRRCLRADRDSWCYSRRPYLVSTGASAAPVITCAAHRLCRHL